MPATDQREAVHGGDRTKWPHHQRDLTEEPTDPKLKMFAVNSHSNGFPDNVFVFYQAISVAI